VVGILRSCWSVRWIFAFSADCVRNERWTELSAYLAERAKALEQAGAEVLLCVSNTLHKTAPVFTVGLSVPFLHIVDPTGTAIRAAGLTRVGLLGTKPVMATDFLIRRYAERFGIEVVVPAPAEQDLVDRIIFDELCRGQLTAVSKAAYLDVIDGLYREGAQGVILGCTEIPLLVGKRTGRIFPCLTRRACTWQQPLILPSIQNGPRQRSMSTVNPHSDSNCVTPV